MRGNIVARTNSIPAILHFTGNQSSISIERALNQIKSLLESYACCDQVQDDEAECDKIAASLDDIDLMLSKIER